MLIKMILISAFFYLQLFLYTRIRIKINIHFITLNLLGVLKTNIIPMFNFRQFRCLNRAKITFLIFKKHLLFILYRHQLPRFNNLLIFIRWYPSLFILINQRINRFSTLLIFKLSIQNIFFNERRLLAFNKWQIPLINSCR